MNIGMQHNIMLNVYLHVHIGVVNHIFASKLIGFNNKLRAHACIGKYKIDTDWCHSTTDESNKSNLI